jgi:hypothetical protein
MNRIPAVYGGTVQALTRRPRLIFERGSASVAGETSRTRTSDHTLGSYGRDHPVVRTLV